MKVPFRTWTDSLGFALLLKCLCHKKVSVFTNKGLWARFIQSLNKPQSTAAAQRGRSSWARQWPVIRGYQAARSLSGHLIQSPLLQFPEQSNTPSTISTSLRCPTALPKAGSTFIHCLLEWILFLHLESTQPSQPPVTHRPKCSYLFLYRNKGIVQDTTNKHRYCTILLTKHLYC